MLTITKIIEWDMGHRVPHHNNKCKHPHGHRYKLEATVTGDINQTKFDSSEGMIIDFGDLKSLLLTHVHDVLDHAFAVSEEDTTLINFFQSNKFNCVVVPYVPTVENMVLWCAEKIKAQLPSHIKLSSLKLYETPKSFATWS